MFSTSICVDNLNLLRVSFSTTKGKDKNFLLSILLLNFHISKIHNEVYIACDIMARRPGRGWGEGGGGRWLPPI